MPHPSGAALSALRVALGSNVRNARQAASLSQDALAEASGVPRSTIARIERGEQEPRISTLLSIAGALGIQLEVLVRNIVAPDVDR
jgi:transcriptional regulator with XRE-family HTH domain